MQTTRKTVWEPNLHGDEASSESVVNEFAEGAGFLQIFVDRALAIESHQARSAPFDTQGSHAQATADPGIKRADSPLPRPLSPPNALAIIIGNGNYAEAPNVDFAHNDAAAFAKLFNEFIGLEPRKVIHETDLTSIAMLRLFGPVGREGDIHNFARFVDEIFVFYSGHGIPEVRSEGAPRAYLLPVDVPPGAPWLGAYALDDLIAQLESLPVERVTVFLDTCFSGLSQTGSLVPNVSGAFGVAVAPPSRQARVSVLAATDFEMPQFAHWLPERGHGAFTWYALEGLRGAADRRGDGRVRLSDLRHFIDEGLTFNRMRQRPSLILGGEDEVIVELPKRGKTPSIDPQEVVEQTDIPTAPLIENEATMDSSDGMNKSEVPPFDFKTMMNTEIRHLQLGLDLMGFSPGPIDGVFGPQTERAIREWLREQNFVIEDFVSVADMEHLNASLAALESEIAKLAQAADRSSRPPSRATPRNDNVQPRAVSDCIWFQGECR